jgi:hypothetical protein
MILTIITTIAAILAAGSIIHWLLTTDFDNEA